MRFAGHDTFHCRLFWLKKGIDFLHLGKEFKPDSGVDLGVGKNMVNSMKFWMKSFDIIDENGKLKQPYPELFLEGGWDTYMENEGTLYLLHYKLCTKNHSSIYNIIFNNFRKIKPEFTQKNLVDFIKDLDSKQNENILLKDFSVFRRMYGHLSDDNIDDGYSGLFTELGFLKELGKNRNNQMLYRIQNNNQRGLPNEILLYCILSNPKSSSTISFSQFYTDDMGVGNIFCLDRDVLEEKLIKIASTYRFISYSSEAGVKELQIKENVNPMDILKEYYGI